MTQQTRHNVTTAMQNEAFTQAKYLRFAAHARHEEDWELARLFQRIADTDRTQFLVKEADLVRLGASTRENLQSAIEEGTEQIELYSRFAEQATAAGDRREAALFNEIRQEKESQRKELEAALAESGYASNVQTVKGEVEISQRADAISVRN